MLENFLVTLQFIVSVPVLLSFWGNHKSIKNIKFRFSMFSTYFIIYLFLTILQIVEQKPVGKIIVYIILVIFELQIAIKFLFDLLKAYANETTESNT